MTRFYAAKQIAEAARLSKQAVYQRIKSIAPAKGGRNSQYDYATLPFAYQRALDDWEHRKAHAGAVPPAPTSSSSPAAIAGALPAAAPLAAGLSTKRADSAVVLRGQRRKPKAASALNDKDRAYRDAALTLCRTVDAAMLLADCSEKRAIVELAQRLVANDVRPELADAARATYLKKRKGNGSTCWDWW